ncbi:MAG: PAS fold protein [Candidatus Methanoperedenaceae archaeon GB37]|nr:MAG: PAS fold protein [Candidatus Methanoperedenaceae archaeon GB37]CAD7777226.1 PAS fold protein [Candidatus Methanoperedenaceae archaeon GB37]
MEDELKKLKQEIEALKEWIDTLDTFVGKLDAEGKLIFCNKAPLKAGGIELEEVYGKYFPDTKWFSHSKTEQKKVTEAIKKAKQGVSSRMETSIRDISGGSISIIFNTQPVIKEGKVKYITIEGKTILQEKRLQEELERKVKERTSALAESEEKYRTLVENSSDGFVIIQDGQFVFVNQAMCKILNLSKKDILKKNVIEFIPSEEKTAGFRKHKQSNEIRTNWHTGI